ncbi:cut9 interacting protein Scn1 [Pseudovirgaria hyperparasitica]|uniref:Cut9 interacting protein Scn1 n=1 Tax=Pseudovirgaria hyperparasitica TaxID=470096 RepID=A0A6A6VSN5_9PEZI|nr:cut9 interacting protein Scn1 [Pseudovirgaria hyperparasitica]KAF2752889.1 cut9 interacting protein Scn1 [Pseudovirgaria hyperparasitica]
MAAENIEEQVDDFPWHIGVYDAHCHPTDTMSSIASIPDMKAAVLTVMATRAQDQELVEQVASKHGVKSQPPDSAHGDGKVVPCFGWHPWFSHQLFDESVYGGDSKETLTPEEKQQHYKTAITTKNAQSLSDEDQDMLASFPDPKPLSQFIAETRKRLETFPQALVGEVGLDKAFRIPYPWAPDQEGQRNDTLTPGGREGRRLSPYHVDMEHQKKVLLAQLRLAGEMRRAVSVHGVQAHGVLFETIKQTWTGHERHVPSKRERKRQKEHPQAVHADDHQGENIQGQTEEVTSRPFPPRICLHSYSGSASNIKQYWDPKIPIDFYASFSTAINFAERETPKRSGIEDVIRAVPDDRILVESDLHTAGDIMDEHLEDMVRTLCTVKRWPVHDGAQRLKANWMAFVYGTGK